MVDESKVVSFPSKKIVRRVPVGDQPLCRVGEILLDQFSAEMALNMVDRFEDLGIVLTDDESLEVIEFLRNLLLKKLREE